MVPELRPRTVGEILDVAVSVFRHRFLALVKVTALVQVPIQALTLVVLLSAEPDDFEVGVTGQVAPVWDETQAAVGLAALVVTLLLGVVASGFVQAAVTSIVADAYVGARTDERTALRNAMARVFPVVGVSIVAGLGIGIGLVLCFVPGIWLMGAWSVAVPALVLERVGVFRALGRSFELTRSRFFPALGVVLIGFLLTSVLTFGLTAIVELIIESSGSTTDVVVQTLANAVAAILTTPLVATAAVALYFDLRIRVEGFDIQMMLSRLDARYAAGRTYA